MNEGQLLQDIKTALFFFLSLWNPRVLSRKISDTYYFPFPVTGRGSLIFRMKNPFPSASDVTVKTRLTCYL